MRPNRDMIFPPVQMEMMMDPQPLTPLEIAQSELPALLSLWRLHGHQPYDAYRLVGVLGQIRRAGGGDTPEFTEEEGRRLFEVAFAGVLFHYHKWYVKVCQLAKMIDDGEEWDDIVEETYFVIDELDLAQCAVAMGVDYAMAHGTLPSVMIDFPGLGVLANEVDRAVKYLIRHVDVFMADRDTAEEMCKLEVTCSQTMSDTLRKYRIILNEHLAVTSVADDLPPGVTRLLALMYGRRGSTNSGEPPPNG